MLNTRDLEDRWLKYKIKSYIPHITIAISSITIIVAISMFLNSNNENNKITPSPKPEVKKVEPTVTIIKKTTKKLLPKDIAVEIKNVTIEEVPKDSRIIQHRNIQTNHNKSLKLSPSLNFMKKMQHSSLPYYQDEPVATKGTQPQIIEEVEELEVKKSVQKATIQTKVQKIHITRRNSDHDIRDIIKRFKRNNNPALSLFVAKKYYELGEYNKAYNYALITNQIDRDIDASWIIFTKSLVKLDQKEMAIKTLKQYIESSHSNSAKILLDEIVSGKFK